MENLKLSIFFYMSLPNRGSLAYRKNGQVVLESTT